MQKKLVMLFIAILLAFVILVGRITYINASSGEDYTKTVLDQQQYMSRSIPFKRGDIVDTNGTKLATSERVYNVIPDCLKGSFCRMPRHLLKLHRYRLSDNLCQLPGCFNRTFLSCHNNMFCYILRKFVLTIVANDPKKVHLTVAIDNLLCR